LNAEADAGRGGSDLMLTDTADDPRTMGIGVPALKAAVDFGVDLRNHDPARTWETGFVDN
jgi:hypothetical protein